MTDLPDEITFTIDPVWVEHGEPNDCAQCPAALALNALTAELDAVWEVGGYGTDIATVRLFQKHISPQILYHLPHRLIDAIAAFDGGDPEAFTEGEPYTIETIERWER